MRNLPSKPVQIVRETKTSCIIDAGFNPGPIGAAFAMKTAIQKAQVHGMGMAAVRHSNHCGTAAYYALMAANAGMLGISMTNASPRLAPWGSVEPIIGNNPWSFALPGADFPIVLDMANTVVANGKIRTCLREGKPLQPGWAMDAQGNPTTDPAVAMKGLLMPIGGYKGVGISVMVDMLTAAISQGAFSKDVGRVEDATRHTDASHFFIAADLNELVTPEELSETIAAYTVSFKAVQKKEGVSEVFLPGEIEWRIEQQRRKGGIPLSEKAVGELNVLAHAVGGQPIDAL
jgi:LDH2 family malate/lactate/ureidoglycolate dehydrogenase